MRARNIKPAFFKNEFLGQSEPLARLLFIGLWCYCDREGRFEWRPKRIKIEILPYDDCDIEKLLDILVELNEIKKYKMGDFVYGFIPNFVKHQNPHNRENDSVYPSYEEKHDLGTDKARPRHDSARLNPESLILNPDILKPELREKQGTTQARPRHDLGTAFESKKPKSKIDYEWYKDFWNLQANTLTSVKRLSKERKTKLKTRIESNKDFKADFEKCILKIQETPFLLGDNDRKWRVDFDWIIDNDTHYLKILEGKYDTNSVKTQQDKEMEEHEKFMAKHRKGPQYEN